MPPKFDPNEVKIIKLRCVGGEVGATASLAPKVRLLSSVVSQERSELVLPLLLR